MSILGLKSGYTVKQGLSPWDCPRAAPSGNSSGSGHILRYIPPLVLIRIHYIFLSGAISSLWFFLTKFHYIYCMGQFWGCCVSLLICWCFFVFVVNYKFVEAFLCVCVSICRAFLCRSLYLYNLLIFIHYAQFCVYTQLLDLFKLYKSKNTQFYKCLQN